MSNGRYELNSKLKKCISDYNTSGVFFNPMDNVKLTYPCIIYNRKFARKSPANNSAYGINVAYEISVISRGGQDHENIVANIIKEFSTSSWDNDFTTDGLLHSLITVYYRL